MAEEEVNYASVVFKANKQPRSEAKKEETVYDEVKAQNESTEQTPDTNAGLLPDKEADSKRRHYQKLACCLGGLSVILLLAVIGVCACLTAVISENNTKLTAENQNLRTQIQELETEMTKLTEQLQNLEANSNGLNVSRAQWSINAYCTKENKRRCKPCQAGWLNNRSSCYAINDPVSTGQKSWEEAREDCRGKISYLVIVTAEAEKKYVNDKSWGSSGINGYWIGLKVVAGTWKWVNGRNLTNQSWIQQSAVDGHCAISVINKGWKSVSCNNRNRWICEKKALII